MSYRYILRYTVDPVFHADDRIEELAQFCLSSRIEEVMFFFTAEELSLGHPTREMCEPWIDVACRLRDRLARDGVDLSLNPWTTTYHNPRGRRLFEGQTFTTMVGPNGVRSPVCACPLCENWQSYLCDLFAEWCRRVKPVALWVEDDWRLHNHGDELGFGGCFCELHMERFSTAVGQPVSREQLLNAVLAPGEPHPWRQIWLDLWRDTLLEPARRLRDAVRTASPTTQLGLMSSDPDTHSIEGRDWLALQTVLGRVPAFLTRPHLPPYTEDHALHCPPAVTRHTIANLAHPIEIYPELENSPRCGPYSKSRKYSIWECLHSVCYGAAGITINAYDMMGNGIALDPHFGEALAVAKDRLSSVVKLSVDDAQSHGVDVLFHPDIARRLHCPAPVPSRASFDPDANSSAEISGMSLLKEDSTVWSRTFFTLGIAHRLTSVPETDGRPVAVSGQTVRCFTDAEIQKLLQGGLLLDGVAAEVLLERGFGRHIGIQSGRWRDLMDTAHAYEQIHEDDPAVFGLARPRMSAARSADRLFDMTLADACDIRTSIHRADHGNVCPGLVVYNNSLGGTVAATAYPLSGGQPFFMGFFNVFRRVLMQNLMFELASADAPLAMAEDEAIHLYRVPTEQGTLLAWLNPTNDVVEGVRIKLGGIETVSGVKLLREDGNWIDVEFQCDAKDDVMTLRLAVRTPPLDARFFLVQ